MARSKVFAGLAEARHLQFVDASLVVEPGAVGLFRQRRPVVIEGVQIELFGAQGIAASFQVSDCGVGRRGLGSPHRRRTDLNLLRGMSLGKMMHLSRRKSGEKRCKQEVKQILTTHKSAPEDRANSVRARLLRTLTVRFRRFGWRIVRRFVVLKDTRNLA